MNGDIGCVVLAAGSSERLGQPKALVRIGRRQDKRKSRAVRGFGVGGPTRTRTVDQRIM